MLISSAENFPDVLIPALSASGSEAVGWLYFVPLLYFGYFFLMSVLLAVVVDEYQHSATEQVKVEQHK